MSEPTIPGYSIVERIGSGGFASVYRATEDASGTEWAIKVLHDHTSSPDDLRRFERERTTMRALSGHPHIVGVNDDGETPDGRHYTVLEYLGGGSVRDRLASNGALHWSEVLPIAVQICAALDVAHRNGVLHRDVKPANILLEGATAKLTDFGIARLVGQSQVTAAQSIIGTLAYTPPEVFHNKPFDGRGDIYQLGISMYEMLLGRAPFTSAAADNKATVIRRILENPAPPLAQFDVPEPVSNLLDDVLAKDPADRPQSAASLIERINEVERALGQAPTRPVADDITMTMGAPATVATKTPPPTPPVIAPPPDAGVTVVDESPELTTRAMATDSEVSDLWSASGRSLSGANGQQPPAAPTPAPAPAPARESADVPAAEPQRTSRRGVWLIAAGILVLALAGGVIGSRLANQDGDDTGIPPTVTDPVDDDALDEAGDEPGRSARALAPLDAAPFIAPGGSDGIIFGSAANSFGLTMVGAAGDGPTVRTQGAQLWTLEPGEDAPTVVHRPSFAAPEDASTAQQRLWGIGVIDNERWLAVGETSSGATTNGIAWIGSRAGQFVPLTDASFTGGEADSLRAAVADGGDGFLVVGRRTDGDQSVAGLWRLTNASGDWASVTWSVIDVGAGGAGVLNDVAASGDVAVAVGEDEVNGTPSAIVKVRRNNSWSDLIAPIPDARLWGVTIAGPRIIAVGELGTAGSGTPFAIIASLDGQGSSHNLPIRGDIGVARDVLTRAGGEVVVVGDSDFSDAVDEETAAGFDRDGAIWQLLPGADDAADFNLDRWTTRASADLRSPGFVEFWTIAEYDEALYVFGRTEEGDTRPAGAWTLDLQ